MKMNHVIWNEMDFSYPDGFKVLDEKEKTQFTVLNKGPMEVISDPERHMIISCGWRTIGGFSSFMLNSNDLTKRSEKDIAKAMSSFGYQKTADLKETIGQEESHGFGYEYKVQDTEMYAETYVIKHAKTVYYLYCYIRKAAKEENLPLWNDILTNIRWE